MQVFRGWMARTEPGPTMDSASRGGALQRGLAGLRSLPDMLGFVESAPDAILVLDAVGAIALVNRRGEALLGRSRHDLLGKPVATLVPEGLRGGPAWTLWPPAEHGPPLQPVDWVAVRGDGSEVEVEATQGRWSLGDRAFFILILRDASERRRVRTALEDKLRRVDEAERATGRGSWEWDVATDKAVWSDWMYLLFGLDRKAFENTNENFLAMVHPDDRDRMVQAMGAAMAHPGPFLQEYRLRRPDGLTRHIRGEGNAIPDAEGKTAVLYGFVQDVTDRKRTEEDLRAANQELEAFAYSVSHDLRAPLRSMAGFAQILLEDHGTSLPREARHNVDMIVDSAREMGQLVDDLLNLSRLGRQAITLVEADPDRIARQVWAELADQRAGRVLEISIDKMPLCRADASLLKQVFMNLLGNAVKYTRNREKARVEVGWDAAAGGAGAYFVRDNGVGFDMRHAGKLFGAFQRLHRAEDYEGTGVGLAIVRRIVARHGGRVWADAEDGKGAAFFFTLQEGTA